MIYIGHKQHCSGDPGDIESRGSGTTNRLTNRINTSLSLSGDYSRSRDYITSAHLLFGGSMRASKA